MVGRHVTEFIGNERYLKREKQQHECALSGARIEYNIKVIDRSNNSIPTRIIMEPFRDQIGAVRGVVIQHQVLQSNLLPFMDFMALDEHTLSVEQAGQTADTAAEMSDLSSSINQFEETRAAIGQLLKHELDTIRTPLGALETELKHCNDDILAFIPANVHESLALVEFCLQQIERLDVGCEQRKIYEERLRNLVTSALQ